MKNILISMETSKSKDLKKTDLTILLMNARIAFRKWFTLRRQYCFPAKSQTDISTQKLSLTRVRKKVPLDNIAQRAESYKPKERVTYKMIKEYIEAKYGFKVYTAYIAEQVLFFTVSAPSPLDCMIQQFLSMSISIGIQK